MVGSRRSWRPAHAQPGVLASLRWSSALEFAGGAIALVAVAVAALASGSGTNPAAAVAPVPPGTSQVDPTAVPPGWTLQRTAARIDAASTHGSSATAGATTQASTDFAAVSALAAGGIPLTALQAYQSAAVRENLADPGCHLPWPLLAAIGRVESDHGRFAGAVLHTDGLSTPRVVGIPLDGHGTALIRDTDHGRLDGDRAYDRAVGPMQFIPSTWATYGADGNADGVADPFNIFDAAAAAAHYLCVAGGDLGTAAGQERAVLAYNHSAAYLREVLQLEAVYAGAVPGLTVPVIPTGPPPPVPTHIPPVNPGPPPSISVTPRPPSTSGGPGTSAGSSPGSSGSSTDSGAPGSSGSSTAGPPGTSASTSTGGTSGSTSTPPGCPPSSSGTSPSSPGSPATSSPDTSTPQTTPTSGTSPSCDSPSQTPSSSATTSSTASLPAVTPTG
jgi:membrane-bound lytic murein transglycosylase B